MTADLFSGEPIAGARGDAFGGNSTGAYTRETWLTPPTLLQALGHFDLDPCAAPEPRPWPTADRHYCLPQVDGLRAPWAGRVWVNPPYGLQVGAWLARLAEHRSGLALVFARTDTVAFQEQVLRRGAWVLFLAGRVTFCDVAGKPARFNAGAPSCLVAYSVADRNVLLRSGLPGALVDTFS